MCVAVVPPATASHDATRCFFTSSLISFLECFDATPIQWSAFFFVQDPSARSQLGPAAVLDLRPLDLRVDDRVVNLDQGPRLTCTRPSVTRSETTSAISPAPVVVEDQIIEVVIGERRVDRALLDSPDPRGVPARAVPLAFSR